jgi:hypothetical protein
MVVWDRVFDPVGRPEGPLSYAAEVQLSPPSSPHSENYRPIFITFTTDQRWQFPPEARDIVLECCLNENGIKFDLYTAVVMPDRTQLLMSPLRNVDGWNFCLRSCMP